MASQAHPLSLSNLVSGLFIAIIGGVAVAYIVGDGRFNRQPESSPSIPSFIAYRVPAGTVGDQIHEGPLGMEFDVAVPIYISHLGVFDSDQDGLSQTIGVAIYNRDTEEPLVELTLFDDEGLLVDGSRFKPLPNGLTLHPGFRGAVVATGYGSDERNGNGNGGSVTWTTDDGGGLIRFTGSARWGYCGSDAPGSEQTCRNGYPLTIDSGPENRYAAGTFMFERAP